MCDQISEDRKRRNILGAYMSWCEHVFGGNLNVFKFYFNDEFRKFNVRGCGRNYAAC